MPNPDSTVERCCCGKYVLAAIEWVHVMALANKHTRYTCIYLLPLREKQDAKP